MPFVEVSDLNKQFSSSGGSVNAVNQVSFAADAGEMLALLGPSGSGKTTLLRCVAGLEAPDSGTITVGGATMFDARKGVNLGPEQRRLGMIFQSYALWPHMRVREIVAYPLKRQRLAKGEIRPRVAHYLDLVGCSALAERFPNELSGGQQQRVGLARALAAEPRLILFDEPLSNLDVNLREQLRAQIRELQRRIGFTGIYVTHDRAEAFFVADSVAVIEGGRLLQQGSPDDVHARPASAQVARFLGANNRLEGIVAEEGGVLCLLADGARLPLDGPTSSRVTAGMRCEVLLRPDELRLTSGGDLGIRGTITDVISLGEVREYQVEIGREGRWLVRENRDAAPRAIGDEVAVQASPPGIHVFPVRELAGPGPNTG